MGSHTNTKSQSKVKCKVDIFTLWDRIPTQNLKVKCNVGQVYSLYGIPQSEE